MSNNVIESEAYSKPTRSQQLQEFAYPVVDVRAPRRGRSLSPGQKLGDVRIRDLNSGSQIALIQAKLP